MAGGLALLEDVPMGHNVALSDIAAGAAVIRYGQTIGFAGQPIRAGEWVAESKLTLPVAPDLASIAIEHAVTPGQIPLEGYTFRGYRNADGSVGTKNVLGVTTSVQCVAGITQYVVKKIKEEPQNMVAEENSDPAPGSQKFQYPRT